MAELIFGYAANSLALISDAVHNLSDVIALLLAWGAAWLAQRQPTAAAHLRLSPGLDPGGAVQCRAAAGRGRRHRRRGGQSDLAEPRRGRGAGPSFWSRRSASSSTAAPRCCSCAAATAISIFAAPICTWRRMPAFRSAWWSRRSLIMLTGWLWLDPAISLVIAAVVFWRAAGAWPATASISRSTACRAASSLRR